VSVQGAASFTRTIEVSQGPGHFAVVERRQSWLTAAAVLGLVSIAGGTATNVVAFTGAGGLIRNECKGGWFEICDESYNSPAKKKARSEEGALTAVGSSAIVVGAVLTAVGFGLQGHNRLITAESKAHSTDSSPRLVGLALPPSRSGAMASARFEL